MAKDRGTLPRVAWYLAVVLAGCGPSVRPDVPFPEEAIVPVKQAAPPPRGDRQVVVGELCPKVADGRPAVAPLLMRATQWTDAAAELTSTIEHGNVPRFVAYGVDGKMAGVFETLGLADITLGQSVASGTYLGSSPCSAEASHGLRADANQSPRIDDPACVRATNGCGLAVGELARPDDPPTVPTFATGGACLSGNALGVDIDGDGVVEWFPLSGILDGIRGPAQEWSASQNTKATCTPSFVQYDVKLAPEAEPGKPPDARATVSLDLLGVIDLDGDGRKDLVIALRFPTVRTVVVYSATSSPRRLDLVGEAQSFQN